MTIQIVQTEMESMFFIDMRCLQGAALLRLCT